MKKTAVIIFFFVCQVIVSYGQSATAIILKQKMDSLKSVYIDNLAEKYPALRQLTFSTDFIGSGNSSTELNSRPLFKGKIQLRRENVNFILPVAKWGKNSLMTSFNYLGQHFNIRPTVNSNPAIPIGDTSFNKNTAGLTLVYARNSTLFGKQAIYTGSVSIYTGIFSTIQRVNYYGSIVLPLKQTAQTSYRVGLAVLLDPSTPFPVLPVFNYWHKFQGNDLELFVDLPDRVSVRKQLSKNSWASIGTKLTGSFFFFGFDSPFIPPDNTYATLELKSGPSFEYLVTKKLIIGANGGIFSTLSSRMFRRNTNPNDYFLKSRNSTVPYINITISFLPFLGINNL